MRKSEIAEARQKQRQAEAEVLVAKNMIRAELTAAWEKWLAAPKLLEAANAQTAAAEEGYRIAKLRYEEGKAIRTEVAQSLADLRDSHAGLAEANAYQRQAWSMVRRMMGG
jgi:cobalt-zinc-cadmium efflux system outer membrane protein